MLTGDNGILTQAQKAKEETEKAQVKEGTTLGQYESYLNRLTGNNAIVGEIVTEGNKPYTNNGTAIIPEGFAIVPGCEDVSQGLVISDKANDLNNEGNQFVWIPVGTIKTTKGDITINLNRYTFESNGDETVQDSKQIDEMSGDSCQELQNSTYGNSTAKNINNFLSRARSSGGYYIGRYEARDGVTTSARNDSTSDTNKLVCISSNFVYNYVTQSQAANLSKNMYKSISFTSDLVNSYAWDTALVFIQKCSEDSDYSQQSSINTALKEKGTTDDVICNIYDMASNCVEFSTETCDSEDNPCVTRGGIYSISSILTSTRNGSTVINSNGSHSFRPILYL